MILISECPLHLFCCLCWWTAKFSLNLVANEICSFTGVDVFIWSLLEASTNEGYNNNFYHHWLVHSNTNVSSKNFQALLDNYIWRLLSGHPWLKSFVLINVPIYWPSLFNVLYLLLSIQSRGFIIVHYCHIWLTLEKHFSGSFAFCASGKTGSPGSVCWSETDLDIFWAILWHPLHLESLYSFLLLGFRVQV